MEKTDLFKPKVDYKERYFNESAIARYRKDEVLSILLDSSLITPTNKKRVDFKIIDCGDYKQVYVYDRPHLKKDKNLEKIKDRKKWCLPSSTPKKESREDKKTELKEIEEKNILRSRFEMQRLVKTNESIFKTFITLTFADNVTNVEQANKKFDIWRTKAKSIYKDFAYVCVPEFQKRGAIHYHLLTNLDIEQSPLLIIPQKGKKCQYDVKYWSYGFTSVFNMKDINVVGYISKYMTKDIDNRLWGHRRYFYSQNLKRPETINIDITNLEDFKHYVDLINNEFGVNYTTNYTDFLNNDVTFIEYKKGVATTDKVTKSKKRKKNKTFLKEM